jgi:hypothetical protein
MSYPALDLVGRFACPDHFQSYISGAYTPWQINPNWTSRREGGGRRKVVPGFPSYEVGNEVDTITSKSVVHFDIPCCERYYLLGCDTVEWGRSLPTFRMDVLPLFSPEYGVCSYEMSKERFPDYTTSHPGCFYSSVASTVRKPTMDA